MPSPLPPLQWFLPSYFGDIRLTREGEALTELRAFQLTPQEREAMATLRERALRPRGLGKPWATAEDFATLEHESYRTEGGVRILLRAPIEKVQALLAKALRPDRQLLSVVRFAGGQIEEIRTEPKDSQDGEPKLPAPAPPAPQPEKAATVARPTVGCPLPDFGDAAELRATAVLAAFLSPEQLADYRRHGLFVSEGADSGHRYMVIHRERPELLRRYGGRQLYDLDARVPLCIHDWEVPAPEEMLALHLHLQIPGQERYLRHLADQAHTS